ncbi:MAG: hypothetical protein WAQ98_20110 [Blastocatellia bacterium]
MRLSKYSILLAIFLLCILILPANAQRRPRGGGAPSPAEVERQNITNQQRELRNLEMAGNNPHKDVDPIILRQMQLKKELSELNTATLAFINLAKEDCATQTAKRDMKEVAKLADKVAKCSKKLREDLILGNFEVKVPPMQISTTEDRIAQMMKIVKSIDELIEQINISSVTATTSEIKSKILARHLIVLENQANGAKELAKNKH